MANSGVFPFGFTDTVPKGSRNLVYSSVAGVVAAGCLATLVDIFGRFRWCPGQGEDSAGKTSKKADKLTSLEDLPQRHYLDEVRETSLADEPVTQVQQESEEDTMAETVQKEEELASLEKAFENYLFLRTITAKEQEQRR